MKDFKTFINNKKGFLLGEETIKILIAVICIVFLVYIIVAVYNSQTSDKKLEQAREDLSRIDAIISSLENGESETQDILEPKGWHLYAFVDQEKPNSCLNGKCLCICERALIKQLKSQAKKCDDKGECLVISRLASSQMDLKIEGTNKPLFIEIKKQSDRIFLERA